MPALPPGAKRRQELDADSTNQIQQYVTCRTNGADDQCETKRELRLQHVEISRPNSPVADFICSEECHCHNTYDQGRATKRMQQRLVKSEKYRRAAKVTGIVQIGGDAGNDKHGCAVRRQTFLPGTRQGERRQTVCDGVQAPFLSR